MKRIIYIYIICLSSAKIIAQQDPQYSLYQFNQMSINPAYAGAREAIAVVMDMRKQWVSFPGAPTTIDLTVHSPILNNKVGVGLNILSDQIGARSVTGIYGNFAYIAKLNNRLKLSFGLRAGYLNYNYNYSKVTYKDGNIAPEADNTKANSGNLDMDAGLFLKSNSFFFGFSITHLNSAIYNFSNYTSVPTSTSTAINYTNSYQLNPHQFIVLGKSFAVNENFLIAPSFMLKSVSTKQTVDFNLNFFIKKRVWLGVYVRQGFGPGFLAQFYVNDKLRIGYSYDTGLGSKRVLGASHEIMLGFDFKKYQSKSVTPRFL
jgi:type IX secretion system PorP/SprF family membrane protein